MKRKIVFPVLSFLSIFLIVASAFMIYEEFSPVINEKNDYIHLQTFAPTPVIFKNETNEDYSVSSVEMPDFASLWNENQETIAWIGIPNTEISYPIVQSSDASFYLSHDFSGQKSKYGAIFLSPTNNSNFSDKVSLIYGHNIPKTNAMFTDLEFFLEPDFPKNSPNFYIYTPDSLISADIFAVMVVKEDSFVYSSSAFEYGHIDSTINVIEQNAVFFSQSKAPNSSDKIVILSTCFMESNGSFGKNRIVILGKQSH